MRISDWSSDVCSSDLLAFAWLGAAALGLVVVTVMRRAKVWYAPLYVVVGVVVWYCTLKSGIHATIAGVALGLLTPARPLMPQVQADAIADRLSSDHDVTAEEVHELELELRASVSVAERLENRSEEHTSYLVFPIFALANAGIQLSADPIGDAVSSRLILGR